MIGYCADLADAENYFSDERLETALWDDLGSGSPLKTKALNMAYNRIFNDPRWDLPVNTAVSTSTAALVKLRKANCEEAYYLIEHLEDEDERKGIQAQAVVGAGVVKEQYAEAGLQDLPVPPFVIALLADWAVDVAFGIVDIARDEEKKATAKASIF